MDAPPPSKGPVIPGGRTVKPASFPQHPPTTLNSHTSDVSRPADDPDAPQPGGPAIPGGPHNVFPGGTEPDPLATPTDAAITSVAGTTSRGLLDDDVSSSDDNMHEDSNSSSVQGTCQSTAQRDRSLRVPSQHNLVTPSKSKRLRFNGRTSTQSTMTSRTSSETSVLSCQLALLAALTAEMESSVNTFQKEQWKARFLQVNQVMQMVQWEANDLYGLADDN